MGRSVCVMALLETEAPRPAEASEQMGAPVGIRPRLLTYPLLLVFLASIGALTAFYLLLSVVPLYAAGQGAAGTGAGLATGLLMAGTVAAELAMPRLTARFGYRGMLAAGLVLLGAPALVLTAWAGPVAIAAACVVRGLGFGIAVVAGGALVAVLVPRERRGEGLGLFGVVAGAPSVVALPLGVWLAGHLGYRVVFLAAGLTALVCLATVPGLPALRAEPGRGGGMLAGLRTPALLRPSLVFGATAMASGVVVAFVPLALTGGARGIAAPALLVQAVAATVSRWWAGRHSDRHAPAGVLGPAVAAAALGILLVALTGSPVAVLGGMTLFGLGFGACQSASLALMLDRVSPAGYGMVSAVWNLAYDAALGVGAAGFGVLVVASGYPMAFVVTAALMVTVLPLVRSRPPVIPRSATNQ
jgi:MFS family permease